MNYTNAVLFLLGLLGVLLHNLIQMNKINRRANGHMKIGEYLKLEKFSICISIIVVVVAIIVKNEIKQLEQVSKWLGIAFMAIGYMGQSLLVFIIGKAESTISKPADQDVQNESKDDKQS